MTVVFALGFLTTQSAQAGDNDNVRWVRDSAEYWALTTATYQSAAGAVKASKRKGTWTVVLDLDETVLDNSTYQLERSAYGDAFSLPTWNAWCRRSAAPAIPGVIDFIDGVRKLNGKVTYISNRHDDVREHTIENLRALGLWKEGDLMCLSTDDEAYNKVARRAELLSGEGPCAYAGKPANVVAYLGDTITDFPQEADGVQDWQQELGRTYFVLPNPMYGSWGRGVTRPDFAAEGAGQE